MTDYLKKSLSALKRIEGKILSIAIQDTYKGANKIAAQCYRNLHKVGENLRYIDDQADWNKVDCESSRLHALVQSQINLGGAHRDRVDFARARELRDEYRESQSKHWLNQ